MKEYFVIFNSDGDTTITPYSKEDLERDLNDQAWGADVTFVEELGTLKGYDLDTNYWGESTVLIIKGEITLPNEKKVVTNFSL